MNGDSISVPSKEEHWQQRSCHGHDTHAIPPQGICDVYKKYQKMSDTAINGDPDVIDFSRGLSAQQTLQVHPVETIGTETIIAASRDFLVYDEYEHEQQDLKNLDVKPCTVYSHADFPGLRLLPSLLPPKVQVAFVDRLLHRDLSCTSHKTNLHANYHIPYPPPVPATSSQSPSFFTLSQSSPAYTLTPLKPHSNHKPLNIAQFLRKRWRWLTFGAQYDWSTRQYPPKSEVSTRFPPDIAKLVASFFPQTKAESGVVLIYSPKDFMPVHRDVSELCERELFSFTLGCDGLFIIASNQRQDQSDGYSTPNGKERKQKTVIVRVRSGDIVQMGGLTRWSWHAMPKVMAGTCPEFLGNWPVKLGMNSKDRDRSAHQKWKGYMNEKRINISCRQVYD